MKLITESGSFQVLSEYETMFLLHKQTGRQIVIGDFYGDPQGTLISDDERYCVMWGCGVIVYSLKEPYDDYSYNQSTSQWKDFFREEGCEKWIDKVVQVHGGLELTQEDSGTTLFLDLSEL